MISSVSRVHTVRRVGMITGLLMLFGVLQVVDAAPVEDSESFFFEPKGKFEIYGDYDSLRPASTYGSWRSMGITYSRKANRDVQWFVRGEEFSRREGAGRSGEVGVYKDWNNTLYTYTAVTAGSKVDYLPQLRVDHDFNIKFGAQRDYVWTIGVSNIDYHNEYRDFILSTGITRYFPQWVLGYRIFRNSSYPGPVQSYSHTFSVMHGKEGQKLTTLTYSFGKQAYLADQLTAPEAVRNHSRLLSLEHRHWLDVHHGYFGEVRYFHLDDGYNAPGIRAGYFWEY